MVAKQESSYFKKRKKKRPNKFGRGLNRTSAKKVMIITIENSVITLKARLDTAEERTNK